MNGEIKWTDVPRDDVIAVLNRDMTDDGTIARAREYHHALCKVATITRKLQSRLQSHNPQLLEALRDLTTAERGMMVAKGERS
jgi:hypothetical protein